MNTTEELKARQLELMEQFNGIEARARTEDRDLTDEESQTMDALLAEAGSIDKRVDRLNKADEITARLTRSQGRKVEPERTEGRISNPEPRTRNDAKWGFRNFGEFASSVRAASRHGGSIDPRLITNAPTTYSSEGVGADGGFAVPPEFRAAIMEKVMGEESLVARCFGVQSGSNTLSFPMDETTPWQSSGSVLGYWESEAGAITQSKMNLELRNIRLNKLTALVPVSEELLEDAPALDSFLRRKAPEVLDFKTTLAIIQGTGVGQPLGILNAGCTIAIDKESGQAADTINYLNIVKMWSRLYAPCRPRSIWLANQDIEPQLLALGFPQPSSSTSSFPAYLPANGLSGQPYATLMGRPIVITEACETLGDAGDLILADMSQYLLVTKAGGLRADVSIHLFFDYDLSAYRFILRIGGMPMWRSSIAKRDGSNTLSCFVTLAARA